jgi:hypothetical protein
MCKNDVGKVGGQGEAIFGFSQAHSRVKAGERSNGS